MNHSGAIASSETWYAADNPHHITSNLVLNSSTIVTIEAGCAIYFDGNYYVRPDWETAWCNFNGTAENPILVTYNQGSPAKGDWEYWSMSNLGTVTYTTFEYGGSDPTNQHGMVTDIYIIDHCTFRYSDFHAIYDYDKSPYDRSITNCIFYSNDNGAYNAVKTDSGNTITFQNNLCVGGSYGIFLGEDFDGDNDGATNIYNNTFYGMWRGISAYRFDGTGAIRIKNNIFQGCTNMAINESLGSPTPTYIIDYNCYYDNVDDVFGVSKGANAVNDNPLLAEASPGTDEDDYRLQSIGGRWTGSEWTKDVASSPCIDTGDPAFDYSNEPSPNGGRINIGFDGNTTYASKAVGEGSSAYEYYYRYLMST